MSDIAKTASMYQNAVEERKNAYFNVIDGLIDYANFNKETLVIDKDKAQMETIIYDLSKRTKHMVASIATTDSKDVFALIAAAYIRELAWEIDAIINRNIHAH